MGPVEGILTLIEAVNAASVEVVIVVIIPKKNKYEMEIKTNIRGI